MEKKCCIETCTSKNGNNDGTYFYRFPTKEKIRNAWFRAILQHTNQCVFRETDEICSNHFLTDCFMQDHMNLKSSAVPFGAFVTEERIENTPKKLRTDKIDIMVQCSVFSCSNTKNQTDQLNNKVIYYPFPKNSDIEENWKNFCNKIDDDFENSYICSEHFIPDDFVNADGNMLKENATPSIYNNEIKIEESDYLDPNDANTSYQIETPASVINESAIIAEDSIMINWDREQERVGLLLEEQESEPEEFEDSDNNFEDHVSVQEDSNDSEQECEEDIRNKVILTMPDIQNNSYYEGRDKSKWYAQPPSRTRQYNIVREMPGVKSSSRHYKTPKECWELFFCDTVMQNIVEHTNNYINSNPVNCSRSGTDHTDISEIQAFFGILLFAGVRKSNRVHIKDLFRVDGSSPEICRLTISKSRFSFLLSCLRFDDSGTRPIRQAEDKLAPIREIFDIINGQFKKHYTVSPHVNVDEMLVAFSGRCPFRVHVGKRPYKYGVKINALCDAKSYYTLNLEVHVGKQPENGPYSSYATDSESVTLRLCDPIYNSGRNVTIDNWNTSVSLAESLLEKRLTILGPMKKNRKDVPEKFASNWNRNVRSAMFGYNSKCVLVSYTPTNNTNVLLISSMHSDGVIDEATGTPEIVLCYNSTKGIVNTVEQLCSKYNCATTTLRWPMVIFYSLMNISAINAFIIYAENNNDMKVKRKDFLELLSMQLLEDQMRKRALGRNIPRMMRIRLMEILKIKEEPLQPNSINVTGRCHQCSAKKNRKTRYKCYQCHTFFCLEHAVMICSTCAMNDPE